MTTTRARHRASASRFHWASRSVVATAAVPVGALAGCIAAAAASSADPALGLAGMTVVAVPLALHAWRTRRTERDARPGLTGRHASTGALAIDDVLAAMGSRSAPSATTAVRIPAPRRAMEAMSIDAIHAIDVRLDEIDIADFSTREERDAEIAKLRRLWESGVDAAAERATGVHAGQAA